MENTQSFQPDAGAAPQADMPVTLTPKAVEMVKITRGQEGIDESHGLRIAVRGGGCSGFEYSLDFENGMSLDADKIFLAVAQYPADDLGAQLECDRDAGGHIIVDEAYHTSVMNCFAAGDIVPGPQLAIAAAADGAIAALAIHKSLVPDARKLEKLELAEY